MKTLRKNKNKKGGDVKKKVKFNSPQNKTHKYSVTSEEKKSKIVDKNIKKCKTVPQDKSDFPCRFRNTIFNDENDYNEYIELLKERNKTTNYKSKAEHYNNIDAMLKQQFKPKFNI
jgi:hypothetical protein